MYEISCLTLLSSLCPVHGNVSYEEPPLRRSHYRRFTVDLSSCVSMGVLWVFMGVMGPYRCMGVYGCI